MTEEEIDDIVGERFGALTVETYMYHGHRDSIWYRCVCDCGNTVTTTYSKLIKGLIRTCGCRRSPMRIDPKDYIGRVYGQWTIIDFVSTVEQTYIRYNPEPLQSIIKAHYYLARCTCGREKKATIGNIKQNSRYGKCMHEDPKSK